MSERLLICYRHHDPLEYKLNFINADANYKVLLTAVMRETASLITQILEWRFKEPAHFSEILNIYFPLE